MKAVVIYSGGMDSYTLLAERKHAGDELYALSFNYGQRHVRELEYAARVSQQWGIPHQAVDLRALTPLLQGSALTTPDIDVPLGHYAEPSMKKTVVPNRNMIMLSIAVGYAVSIEADVVYTAVHAGDHAIYPDCRPEFIAELNDVTKIANYHPVSIETPFLHMTKGEILSVGLTHDFTDYADTWTCYAGRERPCGKCGACTERLEAFYQNQVSDPLVYE